MKNKLLICFIVFCLLINFSSFNKLQDWGDDFAGYVIQAKAVASGSYVALQDHLEKTDYILNYPWGFPILISPVISFFDSNIIVLKYFIYVFFILGLVFAFLLFKDEEQTALLVTAMMASSPYFWEFKNYLLADFPNLCFVLLGLYLIKSTLSGKYIFNSYFSWFLTGLVIFISYMMRNQSIVLLPTLLAAQLITFQKSFFNVKRLAVLLIPFVTFFVFLYLSKALIPVKPVSYLNQYAHLDLQKTILNNLEYYLKIWRELFSTTQVINKYTAVFTWVLIAFAVVGLFTSAKKNSLYVVFFCLSIGIVLVSPFYQGVRYLIPLVPFFFYFFIKGFGYLIFLINIPLFVKNISYSLVLGGFLFLSVKTIFSYSLSAMHTEQEWEGPYKKTSVEMFDFIARHTRKTDLIGFWKPRAMLLYSGRNSIVPFSYQDCVRRKADYYVYYPKGYDQLAESEMNTHSEYFEQIFGNSDFVIFKLKVQGS